MKLTYIGPHDGVELVLPDGRVVDVARGSTVEVDDEHGASLLEQQTNWERAGQRAGKEA